MADVNHWQNYTRKVTGWTVQCTRKSLAGSEADAYDCQQLSVMHVLYQGEKYTYLSGSWWNLTEQKRDHSSAYGQWAV